MTIIYFLFLLRDFRDKYYKPLGLGNSELNTFVLMVMFLCGRLNVSRSVKIFNSLGERIVFNWLLAGAEFLIFFLSPVFGWLSNEKIFDDILLYYGSSVYFYVFGCLGWM